MTPTERILSALTDRGCDFKQNGKDWSARCPAHDDKNPSLSISTGDDGRVLAYCHAGCDFKSICDGLGLRQSDLMPDNSADIYTTQAAPNKKQASSNGSPDKTYKTANAAVSVLEGYSGKPSGQWIYHDRHGHPVGVVVRWDKSGEKTYKQVSLNSEGWICRGIPEPRPLYGLPGLADAERVFITEGEKAADAARAIGLTTTTSSQGAHSPDKTDWSPLAGKECVILPDNNDPGKEYAESVSDSLAKLTPPATVKVVNLDGLPDGGDIDDWIEARRGTDKDELRQQVQARADKAEVIPTRALPRERKRARIEFCPIPASQLGDSEKLEWMWHGYLCRGYTMLLVGLWKAGKSTLLSYLIKAMEAGGDLAGKVSPAKVLVITEEGSGLWARRRDDVGFGDHAHFDIRPFKCRPRMPDWIEYIEMVADTVRNGDYDLVIIDTWQSVSPCSDENDAAGMMAALSPLHIITEAGAAVLVAHHPRKGDASEGQASRGSGALPGFVDTIVELRRFNAQEAEDRRRKLRGLSRFDETPAEVVIELTDGGYVLVGTTGDAKRQDRLEVISGILSPAEWKSAETIRENWPTGDVPKSGLRTLQLDLNHGVENGQWMREGKGRRRDQYRYRIDSRTVQPLSTGNELKLTED